MLWSLLSSYVSKHKHHKPSDVGRIYSGDEGWLAVLEEREEWSCLTQYILSAWEPSYQRFAISMRYPFTMPGIYHWFYPNGSLGSSAETIGLYLKISDC